MLFHLLWRMGAFLCQHEASKIKNTIVRNSFSAVVYTACNIAHTIEKPIAAPSVSSENLFSVGFIWKSTIYCVLLWLYPLFPKRHFLQRSRPLQSQTTALLLHTMFRLQERKVWSVYISLNYV